MEGQTYCRNCNTRIVDAEEVHLRHVAESTGAFGGFKQAAARAALGGPTKRRLIRLRLLAFAVEFAMVAAMVAVGVVIGVKVAQVQVARMLPQLCKLSDPPAKLIPE